MFFFYFFYFFFLYVLFVSKGFWFFNEEILIAVCMGLVFFFIASSIRKLINFTFFFRIEFIYFSFLNLILLNIKLIEKMLDLVYLDGFRFEPLVIYQLYSFFFEFTNEILNSSKLINLLFIKNFVYSFVSNLYTFNFFSTSNNFLSLVTSTNTGSALIQEFSLTEGLNLNNLVRLNSFDLIDNLSVSEIFELFLSNYAYTSFSVINESLDDSLFLSDLAFFVNKNVNINLIS